MSKPVACPCCGQPVLDGPRPIETAPADGTPILVHGTETCRFQPYKPASDQARRGIRGRWQKLNEYGGWDNCPSPAGPWEPLP